LGLRSWSRWHAWCIQFYGLSDATRTECGLDQTTPVGTGFDPRVGMLPVILLTAALLVASYVVLGVAAGKHFDRERLEAMGMSAAMLFWYPFAWPFYDVYKPTVGGIRRAGYLIVAIGVVLALAVGIV
jgi:hypothetical protein